MIWMSGKVEVLLYDSLGTNHLYFFGAKKEIASRGRFADFPWQFRQIFKVRNMPKFCHSKQSALLSTLEYSGAFVSWSPIPGFR